MLPERATVGTLLWEAVAAMPNVQKCERWECGVAGAQRRGHPALE